MKVILAVAVTALAGVTSLHASLPANAAGKTTKISLLATTTSSMRALEDVPPAGMSPGDILQYTETLTRGGRDAGSDVFNLTLGRNGANMLDGYWVLAGGALHVHGKEQCCTAPYEIPVVDGTGKYRGVHGNLVLNGDSETFTLASG
jgi:hypothetical protein